MPARPWRRALASYALAAIIAAGLWAIVH